MRLPFALSLLCLTNIAAAHDPIPLLDRDLDVRRTDILAAHEADIGALGSFRIGYPELAAQLAREPSGEDARNTTCTVLGRYNSNTSAGEYAYWEDKWLGTCGGVLSPHWNAATRLALRRCEAMSRERGVWPPAVPFVEAPASYLSADHHTSYLITHGDVTGLCVFPKGDLSGETIETSPITP